MVQGGCQNSKKVDVLVLQASGEAIFNDPLPQKTTIWELQKYISAKESSCPNKLALLHGSQVLGPGVKLEELQLDVLELSVVRKPQREVIIYTPKQESNELKLQKCIILGEANSGKTQFLRALAGDTLSEEQSCSCGLDFRVLHVASREEVDKVDRKVKIKFWSARGMDRLPECFKNTFFDDAEGYFAVFNLAKMETFTRIRELVSRFRRAVPCPHARRCAMLIGTHADVKRNRRQVSEEEAIRLASELDCVYQEVSSKTRHGIDEALQTWFDLYFDTYQDVGITVVMSSERGTPALD